ncbi:MAG: quinone-dependent dihydroorotate dehydrogenase [Solirubrobacteraceae bacterium]
MFYKLLFRLFLQRIEPERAHALAVAALRTATAVPGVMWLMRRLLRPSDTALRVHAFGLTFDSPLGVAAGMDKDGTWFESLGALGFGFVEVGTITAGPQDGNPGRRVWRLTRDRALLNSMGFPNPGADAAAAKLRAHGRRTLVGVNIGKSMDVPTEHAGPDYAVVASKLATLCDYMVLNVSSPNTPRLREMQSVKALRSLVSDVRAAIESVDPKPPLLVKIAPDLTDSQIDDIADLALEIQLDGIVAVNTTIQRAGLVSADPSALAEGGISGPPLQTRALDVLTRLRARVGDRVTLISVGGIETPDDAWERILAGATLLQAHTGFVYGGPLWPHSINMGLLKRVRRNGFPSLEAAIGAHASMPAEPVSANGNVGQAHGYCRRC